MQGPIAEDWNRVSSLGGCNLLLKVTELQGPRSAQALLRAQQLAGPQKVQAWIGTLCAGHFSAQLFHAFLTSVAIGVSLSLWSGQTSQEGLQILLECEGASGGTIIGFTNSISAQLGQQQNAHCALPGWHHILQERAMSTQPS